MTLLLAEIRAQGRLRNEFEQTLLVALLRMSRNQVKALQDHTRHLDALEGVLLERGRGAGATAALAEPSEPSAQDVPSPSSKLKE